MVFEVFFKNELDGLHAEGRYRVFADLERQQVVCGGILMSDIPGDALSNSMGRSGPGYKFSIQVRWPQCEFICVPDVFSKTKSSMNRCCAAEQTESNGLWFKSPLP
ncbi:hypothetical protein [Rhizobium acaciae]|nr:hypothetical protein [Rhizobium acaciae]